MHSLAAVAAAADALLTAEAEASAEHHARGSAGGEHHPQGILSSISKGSAGKVWRKPSTVGGLPSSSSPSFSQLQQHSQQYRGMEEESLLEPSSEAAGHQHRSGWSDAHSLAEDAGHAGFSGSFSAAASAHAASYQGRAGNSSSSSAPAGGWNAEGASRFVTDQWTKTGALLDQPPQQQHWHQHRQQEQQHRQRVASGLVSQILEESELRPSYLEELERLAGLRQN